VLSSRRSATKTRELRNLRRASRSPSSISARTPTRTVSVSHPTLGGLTERVERVVGHPRLDAQGGPAAPRYEAMVGGTDIPQRLRVSRRRALCRFSCPSWMVEKIDTEIPCTYPSSWGMNGMCSQGTRVTSESTSAGSRPRPKPRIGSRESRKLGSKNGATRMISRDPRSTRSQLAQLSAAGTSALATERVDQASALGDTLRERMGQIHGSGTRGSG
jgi:hypothetical protein